MENKKAQGMSVNTIILIILGLVVLVVLILGFTMGWDNIKDWIAPSNNVQTIVDQCNIACSTDQKYAFCSEPRTLKAEGGVKIENTNCNELVTTEAYKDYGISACPGLCEELTLSEQIVTEGMAAECVALSVANCANLAGCKVSVDGSSCVAA